MSVHEFSFAVLYLQVAKMIFINKNLSIIFQIYFRIGYRLRMQETEKLQENFFNSVKGTFSMPVQESLLSVEKLLKTSLTRDQADMVRSLEKKLTLMHRNTQNISYLSDIQTDDFAVTSQPFALLKTFEKIVVSFQEQARQAGVHLLAYIDPNAPKEVISDRHHVVQIIENLILNAIAYTKRGGSVYLDLKTKKISDTETTLNVSVTDTGVGISRDKLKEYIKPFSRSDENTLGVGLSASFHMLRAMGSQLKIASEPEKGSRFSFSLDVDSSVETMFESHPDIKIGVLIEDRALFAYAKLLYQYIISMGLAVVSIKDMEDENIKECHGVFLVTDASDTSKIDTLANEFPQTCFISALLDSSSVKLDSRKMMLLPALPSRISKALKYIEYKIPKEITQSNEDDHQAIQEVAKIAEKEEKVKILVVEDNPINLKLVKVVLGRYNFEVEAAENGQVALQMCKDERYSIVLMDIDMPVMDGITATKRIKEYEAEASLNSTPIVALTSHDLVGERSEIMASGLDEHMAKPLNIARLELMLEHYLGFKPLRNTKQGK